MKLLIVSATGAEIAPFLKGNAGAGDQGAEVLITGVGIAATVYRLTKALEKGAYDLVINAGIAGSFSRDLPLGEVVQVVSDGFGDLGAENGEEFLDIFELGLAGAGTPPFENGMLRNSFRVKGLPEAAGITVNTVHGEETRIRKTLARLSPGVESMEGAGFFYVCMSEGQKCLQVRAISNYVEKRNRENWNIPLAVNNLNHTLIKLAHDMA
ncbi:MAG TPA: futalosine hydrolase [Anseongella sp.]|nr:futalosine hydrolase [Anseongella sp.]